VDRFPDDWLYLFVAIDCSAKFAVTQLADTADRRTAWEFLQYVLEAVPYKIHTILTDRAIGTPLVRETMARGIQFAEQSRNRNTIYFRQMR
jgi:transposase-like protein